MNVSQIYDGDGEPTEMKIDLRSGHCRSVIGSISLRHKRYKGQYRHVRMALISSCRRTPHGLIAHIAKFIPHLLHPSS